MAMTKKSFEENMLRLEQIVRTMERGEAPLDESLKLFQEGTALVQECGRILNDAELKIKKITAGPDGAPVEEEFLDESAV